MEKGNKPQRTGESDAHTEPPLDESTGDKPRSCSTAPSLLVPTDFTPEAGYALQHAVYYAKGMHMRIVLAHVLREDENQQQAQQELDELLKDIPRRVEAQGVIVKGDLSSAVQNVAREQNAQYIFIGSHHTKTPESFKTSKARQLFRFGTTPYIVVQEPPTNKVLDNVVFPIDYTDENRGKHESLERLHAFYDMTFHLVTPSVNEPELQERVDLNMELAQGLLDRNEIPYTTREVEGRDEFSREVLDISRDVEADLIIVTSAFDPRHPGRYMLEPHERNLLLQAGNIPVMIINPAKEVKDQ